MKNPAFILTNTLFESLRLPCLLVLLAGTLHQAYARESTVSVQLTVPDGGGRSASTRFTNPNSSVGCFEARTKPRSGHSGHQSSQGLVKAKAPKLPVRHLILGKTWNWANKEPYSFLSDPKELSKPIAGAKLVYQAKAKPAPKVPAMVNYIVVYKKEIFTDGKTKQGETLQELAKRHCKELGASPPSVLRIINGFAAKFPAGNVPKLKALPEVKYVEMDQGF